MRFGSSVCMGSGCLDVWVGLGISDCVSDCVLLLFERLGGAWNSAIVWGLASAIV